MAFREFSLRAEISIGKKEELKAGVLIFRGKCREVLVATAW